VIVLDASVALAWCFEDEQSPLADRVADVLRGDSAIVPAIWPFEIANAFLSAERRRRLGRSDADQVAELLAGLPIEVEPISLRQATASLSDIARAYGLSAYDAAYVDLALRLDLPLATLDQHVATAATRAGVTIVV
jgi:predicted nucleic acid-binding protein